MIPPALLTKEGSSLLADNYSFDLEPLYFWQTLPSTSLQGDYRAFNKVKGDKDTTSDTTLTDAHTNMTQANRLSKPRAFSCLAFALIPEFAAVAADVVKVWNAALWQILVDGIVQFQCPVRVITSGTGIHRTDSSSSVVGVPQPQAIISFPPEHSIDIGEGHTFETILKIPGSALTLSANLAFMTVLWGVHRKGVGKAG